MRPMRITDVQKKNYQTMMVTIEVDRRLVVHHTECDRIIRRKQELQCRRDNNEHSVAADAGNDHPWTDEKSKNK
eukprot:3108117-Amphidinium_carterae.2